MRRHQIFACTLMLLTLFSNRLLRADDQPRSNQRETSNSAIEYDQHSKGSLTYKPVPLAPEKILKRWSAASRFLAPVTPQSKVEEFKKGNQTYFTGHELALISEFQQPVTAQTLLNDYAWRVVSQSNARIVLRGQPKDVLTRHLCRPFELQINPQSMLPESLTFLSDSSKQKQGFASIELTALKVPPATVMVDTNDAPQFVARKVTKAAFPQIETQQHPAFAMSPIKRVSFSKSSSENKNEAELQEIEKLVSRWVSETQRIDSIKLGNGARIYKARDRRPAEIPRKLYTKPDGTIVSGWPAFLRVLPPWLINVDQETFIIESFAIELSTDDTAPSASRFITLKIKPNPTNPPSPQAGGKWDAVEIEFSSNQPLPIKISEIRNNQIMQFLLSDMQIQYKQ